VRGVRLQVIDDALVDQSGLGRGNPGGRSPRAISRPSATALSHRTPPAAVGSIPGPRPPHGAYAATISNGLCDHTRAMPRPVHQTTGDRSHGPLPVSRQPAFWIRIDSATSLCQSAAPALPGSGGFRFSARANGRIVVPVSWSGGACPGEVVPGGQGIGVMGRAAVPGRPGVRGWDAKIALRYGWARLP
jgi:hypothetical protein